MSFFEKYKLAISIGIALVLSLIAVLVWKYNQDRLEFYLAGKVSDTAKLIVQQAENVLEDNVNRLENLKHRLEMTDGDYFQYWNRDAARIVETEDTFLFVEWIDSTMVIQRVEPQEDNEEAVGLDISLLDYRNSDWIKARNDSIFNMTHWLDLTQNGQAFLVDEPVYINEEFYGTITAGMDFTAHFDHIMQGLDEYHVNITDDSGTVFYTFGSSEGIDTFRQLEVSEHIQIEDANQSVWSLTMVPNYLFAEVNSISNNNMILAFALILSMLFAVSFFLTQKSKAAKRISNTANQRLRALIDSSPIGIFVIDTYGNIVDFWNPAMEKMMRRKRKTVLGKNLGTFSKQYKEVFSEILNLIKKQEAIFNYEIKHQEEDNTERTFRLNVSDGIGKEDQMMVLLEEITKEKEYEQQLVTSLHEKNILLSEIHHRVKNNLAIIVGLIELQYDEVDDRIAKSLLDETKNRIYSISGVHELLYQTDNFSEISFVEYMNELVNRLRQSYEDENNPVIISKEISGFGVNINQAIPLGLLLNELITNSYKHAFEGVQTPKITLHLTEKNGYVHIDYRDNGKGFDIDIFNKASSLGVTIIKTSLDQLGAEYEISGDQGFFINFRFPVKAKGAHSNL